jgi:putative SOS response-associated peptidase YedK
MINARGETASGKPSFKNAFIHRRCLVPADGFYEWKKNGKSKTPFYIHHPSGRPMSFAGLWEAWTGKPEKKGGSTEKHELPTSENFEKREGALYTFTIITTAASAKMAPLHDRMPVIVPAGLRELWLDPTMKDRQELEKVLTPAPDDDIVYHEVSRMVNSPGNNVPACIEAV